jgi:hypothetical protein
MLAHTLNTLNLSGGSIRCGKLRIRVSPLVQPEHEMPVHDLA